MTARTVLYGEAARAALRGGLDQLADAVATTLGPTGRKVALDRTYGPPLVVDDGVTVAREIELGDPVQNVGARLIRQAAEKAEEATGDGTTTATVLAQAIVRHGWHNVAAGANPMAMKRGLDAARAVVDEAISQASIPIASKTASAQVAAISAHDEAIGELIADVLERVGREGAVTVEEARTLTDEVEYVEGMRFDRGYLSPYFVTDPERLEATVAEPAILLTDRRVASQADIVPTLEKLLGAGKRGLLIVADEVEGDALAILVVNRLRGALDVLAVKAPGFGDRRKELLGDLAALTGATVISEELGKRLDAVTLDHLGAARRAIADKDATTIVGGRGDPTRISARAAEVRAALADASSDFDRERLRERLARLVGGVAVIRAGAATEVELKEKKHRIEDALAATRAALEEGIVPGGGVVLLRARAALDGLELTGDEATGAMCLRLALDEPMRRIAANAGYDPAVVVESVLRSSRERDEPNLGFDAVTGTYGDMIAAGIVDPARVTHAALEAAVSVASMILTSEALVAEAPEPEAAERIGA
jgi:chaperonin GroEL